LIERCRRARANERNSGADETGVEATGGGDVLCATDDGAAVGEEHDVVLGDGKAQSEFVDAHLAEGFEAEGQFDEIQRTGRFMDLHGVAPAEADRDTAWIFEIAKLTARADGTGGIRRTGVDLARGSIPNIERMDTAGEIRPTD